MRPRNPYPDTLTRPANVQSECGATPWVSFTVLGIPVPAPRQSRRDIWKPRPCVVRYRAFRDRVREQLPKTLPSDPSHLCLVIWLPLPKSWSKKKKAAMKGEPHRSKPDSDNLAKAAKDALWDQDSGIWCESTRKFWDDGKGPRVEVLCM